MYNDRKITNPWYRISIHGKPLPEEYKRYITEVSVDEADNQATIGRIVIDDIDKVFLNDKSLVNDIPIKIEMGHYEGKRRLMLDGKLSMIEADFTPEGTTKITLHVLDKSKDMGKVKKSRTWKNKTKADVVKQIASEYGLIPKINAKGLELETITQNDESDIQLIQRLTSEEDYAFYITAKNELYWGEKELNKSPSKTLMYAQGTKDIISFRPTYIEKYREVKTSTRSNIDLKNQDTKTENSEAKNKGSTTNHSPIPRPDESYSGGSETEKGVYIHYDTKGNTRVESAERVKR